LISATRWHSPARSTVSRCTRAPLHRPAAPASCVASRAERARRPWQVSPRVRLAPAGLFDRAGARLGRSKRGHALRSRRQVNRAIFHPRNEKVIYVLRFFFALVEAHRSRWHCKRWGRRPAGIGCRLVDWSSNSSRGAQGPTSRDSRFRLVAQLAVARLSG
jgi:hypothetical protein